MSFGIIIPTRDRFYRLKACLPHWVEQDLPIVLVTPPEQVWAHREWLRERGLHRMVRVATQGTGTGIGYARWACVRIARHEQFTSFIMADDDVYPDKDADVRPMLKFVALRNAMGVSGWMSNYGMWMPDGNTLAKRPNLVVPVAGGHDRIMALNTALIMQAGSFNRRLDILYENADIQRQSVAAGYLWFVHTGVHIKMLGKRNDEGGIVALAGGLEKRLAREKACHRVVYETWGPEYISHPDKRYSCRWQKFITHHIGPRAAQAVKEPEVYEDHKVPTYTRRER